MNNDKTWKIKNVMKHKQIQTKYGDMMVWKIALDGQPDPNAWLELVQKLDTPDPEIGQETYGHIEDTKWGLKFKKGQKNDYQRQEKLDERSGSDARIDYIIQMLEELTDRRTTTSQDVTQTPSSVGYDVDLSSIPENNGEPHPADQASAYPESSGSKVDNPFEGV